MTLQNNAEKMFVMQFLTDEINTSDLSHEGLRYSEALRIVRSVVDRKY